MARRGRQARARVEVQVARADALRAGREHEPGNEVDELEAELEVVDEQGEIVELAITREASALIDLVAEKRAAGLREQEKRVAQARKQVGAALEKYLNARPKLRAEVALGDPRRRSVYRTD